VQITNGHLSARVLNELNNVEFTLDLYLLKQNRYRMRFNELNGLRKRFEPFDDVIVDKMEQDA
jgi:hypothetical protein